MTTNLRPRLLLFSFIFATLAATACVRQQPSTEKTNEDNLFDIQRTGDTKLTLTDFTDVAAASIDAVVHIKTEMAKMTPLYQSFFGFIIPQGVQRQVYNAYGSGVIISSDGYILTNNHVVQDAASITVTLNDRRMLPATLVGHDPATDLAVIKIEATGLTHLPFGNSDQARVGEPVLAIGNPFNLTSTVTSGIISAKARNMHIIEAQNTTDPPLESFIQTDAAVNSGNSGGALVNSQAQLIGIVTAIASGNGYYTGYSFAIPSNLAAKVASDLTRYGHVQRAYLGIQVVEVNDEIARQKNATSTRGLYVAQVTPQCAADLAGLKQGDIILNINNTPVNTFAEMTEEIGLSSPGDTVAVTYEREGKAHTVQARLLNANGDTKIIKQ